MSKQCFQHTFAADGDADYNSDGDNQRDYTLYVDGDFGTAGTLSVLYAADDTLVFIDSGITPIAAAAVMSLYVEARAVRFTLAGATAPDLRVTLRT